MPVLNLADDIRLGASQVDRVYLGTTEIWTSGGIFDDFERADSTSIGSDWTETSGNLKILSGVLTKDVSVDSVGRHNTSLESPDHYAQATQVDAVVAGTDAAVCVRMNTSVSNTYYMGRYSGGKAQIYKRVTGTFTLLADIVFAAPTAPYTLRLIAAGSSISLQINGATVASVTDSSITAGNHVGVRLNSAGSFGEFRANTVDSLGDPLTLTTNTEMLTNSSWTWFHQPVGVYNSTINKTIYAASRPTSTSIVAYDHALGRQKTSSLLAFADQNDHHVAAVGIRSDGKIIAAYSKHNQPMRVKVSTASGDVSAWSAETVVDSDSCTYPRLVYLSGESKWYLFYRKYGVNNSQRPNYFVTSTDGGASWSTPIQLHDLSAVGSRPYMRIATNGVNRIDFLMTTGHPNEVGGNSVWHFYYDGGTFYDSAGTSIGTGVVAASDWTQVYDGTTTEAWIWDITYDGTTPVALFTTFPSATDHRYFYGRWNGSSWASAQVATAGRNIYESPPVGQEEYEYTAGGCFGLTANEMYLCREVSADTWELQRWTTADSGATWAFDAAITSGSDSAPSKNYRPYRVDGGGPIDLLWLYGPYSTYLDWSSSVMAYAP